MSPQLQRIGWAAAHGAVFGALVSILIGPTQNADIPEIIVKLFVAFHVATSTFGVFALVGSKEFRQMLFKAVQEHRVKRVMSTTVSGGIAVVFAVLMILAGMYGMAAVWIATQLVGLLVDWMYKIPVMEE